MQRKLFNLAAAVSLVLFVATTVLWARSYSCWDSLNYDSPVVSDVSQLRATTESVLGSLSCNYVWLTDLGGWVQTGSSYAEPGFHRGSQTVQNHPLLKPTPPPQMTGGFLSAAPDPTDVRVRTRGRYGLGFGYLPEQYTLVQNGVAKWKWHQGTILLPHWALALLFGIVPLCRVLVARRQLRRRRERVCVMCGYDLRATPDRCPECGAAPERPAASAA